MVNILRFLKPLSALLRFSLASDAPEPPTYILSLSEELTVLTMRRNAISQRMERQSQMYDACMATKHEIMMQYIAVSQDFPGEKAAAQEVWEGYSCWSVQLPLVDMQQELNGMEERVGELEKIEEIIGCEDRVGGLEEEVHGLREKLGDMRGLEEAMKELGALGETLEDPCGKL